MEDFKKALNYSFLLLKYRPRSRQEIIQRLSRKKYHPGIIEKVVLNLEENNYINDEEFVRLFVSSAVSRGWGKKRIDYALKKLGVDEQIRTQALPDKQIFREKLKELVDKKISGNKKKDIKSYQKIVRSLATKGFNYDDIIRELEMAGFRRPKFSGD